MTLYSYSNLFKYISLLIKSNSISFCFALSYKALFESSYNEGKENSAFFKTKFIELINEFKLSSSSVS